MRSIGRYTKSSAERKKYSVNYASWLAVGETLSDVDVSVLENTDDDPLVVDEVVIADDSLSVSFFVSDGYNGETYTVVVEADTSDGQVKEDHILFVIED